MLALRPRAVKWGKDCFLTREDTADTPWKVSAFCGRIQRCRPETVGRSPVLIIADENIPCVREVFAAAGEVRTCAGREMTRDVVAGAEMLLVRSVTKVNEALLEGSRVKFVATATIGLDHIDVEYLRRRGIAFAAAPGSNARSVAEYVAAALLVLQDRGFIKPDGRLEGATLGIVGVGDVGSRVDEVARALGMKTLLNDPPRARRQGPEGFVSLDELCSRADVVTFHVPLEREGPDATHHIISEALMRKLKAGAVVVNTSRGAVHNTEALRAAKRSGALGALVLDVWENEPAIDSRAVRLADLATPHVAGYSYDGKVAGTRMIYEAACRFLGLARAFPEGVPPRPSAAAQAGEELVVKLDSPDVLGAVRASYDVEADDARLREVVRNESAEERAAGFDRLRREYPRRREFANWRVVLAGAASPARSTLERLGFKVEA